MANSSSESTRQQFTSDKFRKYKATVHPWQGQVQKVQGYKYDSPLVRSSFRQHYQQHHEIVQDSNSPLEKLSFEMLISLLVFWVQSTTRDYIEADASECMTQSIQRKCKTTRPQLTLARPSLGLHSWTKGPTDPDKVQKRNTTFCLW